MLKQVQDAVRRLFRAEGQEGITTPPGETATFTLQFGDLEVGSLELRDGVWEFKYSRAFRDQLDDGESVHPLVDFPDSAKVYQSNELWPFFMARIPSVSQPRVLEEIERRGLDQTSASQLLQAFGERSIANPFRLRAV